MVPVVPVGFVVIDGNLSNILEPWLSNIGAMAVAYRSHGSCFVKRGTYDSGWSFLCRLNLTDRSVIVTCVTLLEPSVQIETAPMVPSGLVWIVEV